MDPDKFMQKWRCDRRTLRELLNLETAQINRWFMDPAAASYRAPRQIYLDRLDEIDMILQVRSLIDPYSAIGQTPALQRINSLIPEFPLRIQPDKKD